MAQLSVQKISLNGMTPAYNAAAVGGDSFINNGRTFLSVRNSGASSMNVTIDSKALSNFGTDVNILVTIPAGVEKQIGSFEPTRFNDEVGITTMTYSSITSVTVLLTSY